MVNEGKKTIRYLGQWLFLSLCVGIPMGGLSAFFLKSLSYVTKTREQFPWLLLGLPLVGFIFSYLYTHYGKNAQGGNNLVIKQVNGGREQIPLRLIPLTLFGTIFTHLFGGSVGREGTAVQMGGSVADNIAKVFSLKETTREIVIVSGMAAGFSSVFGTPLAGTVFAMEVLVVGKIRSEALFPAFFASLIANQTTLWLGATHTHYAMGSAPKISLVLVIQLLLAAICFGLTGRMFAKGISLLKKIYSKYLPHPVWRNTIGGFVVVIAVILLNGWRYTGLSTELLTDAFNGTFLGIDFVGKLFYTVLSLGAGFQGGEVTPLFEIGATLGADLGHLLGLSVPFLAGLGYIGVFAAATNTPIACFIMGVELFGGDYGFYFFFVAVVSVLFSGRSTIYQAQQFPHEKYEYLS